LKITVLAGGTGSAKLLRGLARIVPEKNMAVIVNVGDNFKIHGLTVCPDLDTTMYMFAGILDKKRGWGIKGDTFNFQKMLKRYKLESWFNIGDMDLATHIYRTNLLAKGLTLTEVTKILCKSLNVKVKIFPATNSWVETRIKTVNKEIHLQEFWVKKRGKVKVLDVKYSGIEKAKVNIEALNFLLKSDGIIVCPANPITSIKPIILIPGMLKKLRKLKSKVLAVSPIIGNSPVSGPAGTLMKGLGLTPISPFKIAELYKEFVGIFVIDNRDIKIKDMIEKLGLKCLTANILMKNLKDEVRLAKFCLKALNLSP